jgi:hypothetical protein
MHIKKGKRSFIGLFGEDKRNQEKEDAEIDDKSINLNV